MVSASQITQDPVGDRAGDFLEAADYVGRLKQSADDALDSIRSWKSRLGGAWHSVQSRQIVIQLGKCETRFTAVRDRYRSLHGVLEGYHEGVSALRVSYGGAFEAYQRAVSACQTAQDRVAADTEASDGAWMVLAAITRRDEAATRLVNAYQARQALNEQAATQIQAMAMSVAFDRLMGGFGGSAPQSLTLPEVTQVSGLVERISGASDRSSRLQAVQELSRLLAIYRDDPGFALGLADQLDAEVLAQLLSKVQSDRNQLVLEQALGNVPFEEVTQFDEVYADLIDGLGVAYGQAASVMSIEDLVTFTDQWTAVLADPATRTFGQPLLLSLVVSRGDFPAVFLTGLTQAVTEAEGEAGVGYWGDVDPPFQVVDPKAGGDIEVADPLYGVYRSAALHHPEWFAEYFTGHGTVDVEVDHWIEQPPARPTDCHPRQPVTHPVMEPVDEVLYRHTRRGFDDGSIFWFNQGLTNLAGMVGLGDGSGALAWRARELLADVGRVVAAAELVQADWEALDWWEKYHHTFLQLGALALGLLAIPFTGPAGGVLLGSSFGLMGVDVAYSFAEGEFGDGFTDLAFIVLPVKGLRGLRSIALTEAEFRVFMETGELRVPGRPLMVWDESLQKVVLASPSRMAGGKVAARFFGPMGRSVEVGFKDGSFGVWTLVKRGEKGAIFQAEKSGVPLRPDGRTLEYRVQYIKRNGKTGYVDFDSHFWHGEPPVEVFQEMKDGYWVHLFGEEWPRAQAKQLKEFEDQAERQLAALEQNGYKGTLEWHFSDQDAANFIKAFFEDEGIDILVYYNPM